MGIAGLRDFHLPVLTPWRQWGSAHGGVPCSTEVWGTCRVGAGLNPVPVLQCQLGVLPLGTGNDLARVLGWGSLCDDDTQLLQILEKLERATTKMLDR